MFDELQTFFIDPTSVDNAAEVLVTSVYLYFKRKPHIIKNRSGIEQPGVTIQLLECNGETPNPTKPIGLPVRVDYNDIYALKDASAPTVFAYSNPSSIKTNAFYAIGIQYDDKGFKVWRNEQGRRVIGTNNDSPGKSRARNGCYYKAVHAHLDHYWKSILDNVANGIVNHIRDIGNERMQYKAFKNRDLKYVVNIAKFNTQPSGGGGSTNTAPATTIDLVNDAYEFFTINAISGVFVGGETVFANNAALTGTVAVAQGNTTVVGTGTTFTSLINGGSIVISSGNTNFAGTINSVSNNTILTLNSPPSFTNTAATFKNGITGDVVIVDYVKQKATLKGSSAANGAVFAAGQQIRGVTSNAYATIQSVDNLNVDKFIPHVKLNSEIASDVGVTFDIAYANGASYVVDSSFDSLTDGLTVNLTDKPGYILSRSTEVSQSGLFGSDLKSLVIRINVAQSNSAHSAPRVNPADADIVVGGFQISNTYLTQAANGMFYDSETDNHGAALSKHISKRFEFGKNQLAEDLRLFVSANKPAGTDLRVYAKFHNSSDNDTFDDKKWTLLECVDNANVFSSTTNLTDIIEYEYGVPSAPESESTVAGTFATSNNSAVVTGTSGTVSTDVPVGRLVKVYSPYFADNYLVGRVIAANTSSFTLDNSITDNNVLGDGFLVDLLTYTQSAFNNKQNSNILRYYNTTGATIDGYDSIQIKIVQLADTTNIVPRIKQYEVIGVSA